MDRTRATAVMQQAGLDALALFQPEAFKYAVGSPGGVATMWRRAGGAIALVPGDTADPIVAIVGDHAARSVEGDGVDVRSHPLWIDTADFEKAAEGGSVRERFCAAYPFKSQSSRPETFDRGAAFGLLGEALGELGLSAAVIGADLEFLPAADFAALQQTLPHVRWKDGSEVFRRLRAVKSPREIERLRRASKAAEAGIAAMKGAVSPGASIADLSAAWRAGAYSAGIALSGSWDFISVGSDPFAADAVVADGAIIKADVGCLVDGYSSDGARTFSWGSPNPFAVEIFKSLETAFHAGLQAVRPGAAFGDVHAVIMGSLRKAGWEGYGRGHFGHSLGASVGSEEWPFFSANNPEVILPGMVLALETPFYGKGIGALMIEDQLLVTETGVNVMNTLSRELIDLSRA